MNENNGHKTQWPNLHQWLLIFIVNIWILALICTGLLIALFLWIARTGAKVVIPSILIAFLAGNCPAGTLSTFDQNGVVTIILQRAPTIGQWQDTAYRVELQVDKGTMVGTSANVYSNSVLLATLPVSATLVPTPAGMAQVVDLTGLVQVSTGQGQGFLQWRIPTHDLSLPNGAEPQAMLLIACGVLVLVVGGIAVYEIVKCCNRLLPTNNTTTNTP